MKPFTTLAIVVFLFVALVHILRLLLGWEVIVDGASIPMWASVVGLLVAVGLAAMLWWENRK